MIRLYLTEKNGELYKKVADILKALGCKKIEFDFSESKPKISEKTPCPFFFNLSHSKDKAVIAISEHEVGVDLEVFSGKVRKAVLSRFSEREQSEIKTEADFLMHWTAREAFIKLKGKTLAEYFSRMEFYGGYIYISGKKQNHKPVFYQLDGGIIAVCGIGEIIGVATV